MSKRTKYLIIIFAAIILTVAFFGYSVYRKLYLPNVVTGQEEETYLYIATGSNFEDVTANLEKNGFISDISSFRWASEQINYPENIKAGRYKIRNGMSNKALVALLKSGQQEPVKVVFNNIRLKEQLAGVISRQIEADSISIIALLNNQEFLSEFGLTAENSATLFIPNTYEFYWNTSAEGFIERMHKEHRRFWNERRRTLLDRTGLTIAEVSVLASIVEQETKKNDEKPLVAGVYLNRLRKNWNLEADPTLIFATRDFSAKRVLNIHKEVDSPYNTYKNRGLPPGPICIPSITSIDAVLNYKEHEYMFFCAKDDFSGYHSFARTYQEHLLNARKFQNELNRRKIRA